jgi:hypothetical protein
MQGWNVIDFAIVLAFALDLGGLSHLVVIRIARSLRLTRLIRFGPVVLLQEVRKLSVYPQSKYTASKTEFGIFVSHIEGYGSGLASTNDRKHV